MFLNSCSFLSEVFPSCSCGCLKPHSLIRVIPRYEHTPCLHVQGHHSASSTGWKRLLLNPGNDGMESVENTRCEPTFLMSAGQWPSGTSFQQPLFLAGLLLCCWGLLAPYREFPPTFIVSHNAKVHPKVAPLGSPGHREPMK